ncbi:MAG: Hpt domain-containing protein [Candidatus Anammoxibacter sp.]
MNGEKEPKHGEKIVVRVDEELEELIPGFLENRHEDIRSILNALAARNFETIRILGHSMKGSGGGYGFNYITDIGKDIEHAALEANVNEIKRVLDELVSYLKHVSVVYE